MDIPSNQVSYHRTFKHISCLIFTFSAIFQVMGFSQLQIGLIGNGQPHWPSHLLCIDVYLRQVLWEMLEIILVLSLVMLIELKIENERLTMYLPLTGTF